MSGDLVSLDELPGSGASSAATALTSNSSSLEAALEWADLEYKISTASLAQATASKIKSRFSRKPAAPTPAPARDIEMDVVEVEGSARSSTDGDPSMRVLIQPTSGFMPKNKFIAIMGSSGAGKTTFLNTLSGQLKVGLRGQKSGVVRIDGRRLTKQVFQEHCAYVQQQDALSPLLTVEETIMFHAHMRLPASMGWKEKQARVDDVIRKLGLEGARHTRIGDETVRGVSGGEKRRASIAVEMISNPDVLFLDEPTSGLDSKMALNLAETLSDLAHNHNHTIICTIHQPRSQIFDKFDYLMLLAKGHIVYYGEANKAIEHFTRLGYPCPVHENPADFFIDLLTIDSTTTELQETSTQRVNDIILASKTDAGSMVAKGTEADQRRQRLLTKQSTVAIKRSKLSLPTSRGAYWPMQVFWLWLRTTLTIIRNPPGVFSRFAPIVVGLLTSLLWLQMDNDQTAISDRRSLLFLVIVNLSFPEAFACLVLYPLERAVYQRERENRVYSASSYWLATQLAHLPLQILAPIPFLVLVYWATGLHYNFARFVAFVAIVVTATFCANSLGMFMGAMFPVQIGTVATPVTTVMLFLFGGFLLDPNNMPDWLYWARYLSWFTYSNDALVVNEFSGLSFYCKDDQFQRYSINATCDITGQVFNKTESICPITDGQQVIDSRDNDILPVFANVLVMFGMVLLLRALLYLPLRYAKPRA